MPPRSVDSVLKQSAGDFARLLNAKGILSELLSAGVFDDDEFDAFLALKRRGCCNRELTEDLLVLLRGKSSQQKLAFLGCVRAKQPHLVRPEDARVGDSVTSQTAAYDISTHSLPEQGASMVCRHNWPATTHVATNRASPVEEVAEDDLTPSQRQQQVSRRQVLKIGKMAAPAWKKLVLRLSLAGHKERMAFDPESIATIEREEEEDEDRLIAAISRWLKMSKAHNWGLLWEACRAAQLTSVARRVFSAKN